MAPFDTERADSSLQNLRRSPKHIDFRPLSLSVSNSKPLTGYDVDADATLSNPKCP
jgi:hypothetical protein